MSKKMGKDKIIPVVKNNNYIMIIDDIGTRGEGIGKIDGYTLFVEGALPKEEVEVKVLKTKKNYGFAKLLNIIKPSTNRVEPICNISKQCGGCQLQHLSYDEQLIYKQKKVENVLQRIGQVNNVKVNKTIGMDNPYYYRNKVQFPVRQGKNGNVEIGFYSERSHRIVETDTCYIQHPINEQIVKLIREFILENNISPYNEEKHRGLIRHIITRISSKNNDVNITIVINGNKLPHQDNLIKKLTTIKEVKGICININKEKTNVILGNNITTIWGETNIVDSIGNINYRISPKSFYQVNPIQTKKLYEKALEYADLSGEEIVWDAYCGIGTITLFLAKKAKKVYGVEIVKEAIEDAKQNAILNKINNVDFFVGKAEEVIKDKYEQNNIEADVIVVDPPRKGCDEELLKTIIEMNPKKAVYVSCDPATLARDVRVLMEAGYELKEVQPVDMFPQTVHVECVTVLYRQDS
ncbi:MAG: 23S rRNA (uracil(1939)-C(5))-methyltransferase RlmD [Firmicutes bacterium]|jgi:23S rRNA (uracil1939-C5)-methyltransferase|nr:23S rRNA (uracil(1939)-C(5))-methyltransferase RlmD [Bacillota bacterium]